MIDGLKLTIAGVELRSMLSKAADKTAGELSELESKQKRFADAGLSDTEQVTRQMDRARALMRTQEFAAGHIDPDQSYLIDIRDLENLGFSDPYDIF